MPDEQRPPDRIATLVLITADGTVIGALPPVPVGSPWFSDVAPVVSAVRERHGVEATILRLITGTPGGPDGRVTYLAEVDGKTRPAAVQPWRGALDDHPLRLPWARPGGPAADIAWAREALEARGMSLVGPPEQVRTWNLSSLWRLPVVGQTIWFKSVPPFFEHEGRMLELLQGRSAPRLLGHDGRRMLLHEIPGADMYEPTIEQRLVMVGQLVSIQEAWIDRVEELIGLGLPDWRAPALSALIRAVVERVGAELAADVRRNLGRFVDGLEERFAQVAECGLPDTLVHGDFHPANHRADGSSIVLLDWGDSGVGQPLLDQPAFLEWTPESEASQVRQRWVELWQRAVPGSDPARAATLLTPIAAARQAVIYQNFLDNIEPAEQPYHVDDPPEWLGRTARMLDG